MNSSQFIRFSAPLHCSWLSGEFPLIWNRENFKWARKLQNFSNLIFFFSPCFAWRPNSRRTLVLLIITLLVEVNSDLWNVIQIKSLSLFRFFHSSATSPFRCSLVQGHTLRVKCREDEESFSLNAKSHHQMGGFCFFSWVSSVVPRLSEFHIRSLPHRWSHKVKIYRWIF